MTTNMTFSVDSIVRAWEDGCLSNLEALNFLQLQTESWPPSQATWIAICKITAYAAQQEDKQTQLDLQQRNDNNNKQLLSEIFQDGGCEVADIERKTLWDPTSETVDQSLILYVEAHSNPDVIACIIEIPDESAHKYQEIQTYLDEGHKITNLAPINTMGIDTDSLDEDDRAAIH